jgi:hypothetical protein
LRLIPLEAGAPEHRGEDDQRRCSVDERDELGVDRLTDELLELRPKVVCASSVEAHIYADVDRHGHQASPRRRQRGRAAVARFDKVAVPAPVPAPNRTTGTDRTSGTR